MWQEFILKNAIKKVADFGKGYFLLDPKPEDHLFRKKKERVVKQVG